jgi:hypothetical protein
MLVVLLDNMEEKIHLFCSLIKIGFNMDAAISETRFVFHQKRKETEIFVLM